MVVPVTVMVCMPMVVTVVMIVLVVMVMVVAVRVIVMFPLGGSRGFVGVMGVGIGAAGHERGEE